MNYQYNELDYAKEIYVNGFLTNHIMTELKLVAVYIRRVLNRPPKLLKRELYEFGARYIPDYRVERDYVILDKAIRFAVKKDSALTHITSVAVHQNELDYLLGVPIVSGDGQMAGAHDYICRKVMFTYLIYMKLNTAAMRWKNQSVLAAASAEEAGTLFQGHSFKGGAAKYNKIKRMANLPDKTDINCDVIGSLGRAGLVTILFQGMIRLNFMDELYELGRQESPIVIEVRNFDHVGWYLDYHLGQPRMKLCSHCGAPFKQHGHRQEYCGEQCAQSEAKERTRLRVQKHRQKLEHVFL